MNDDLEKGFFSNARRVSREKAKKPPGYLGLLGKGIASELTMGYGVSDEIPRLKTIPQKVAYGAGALAGMLPSFAAAAAVPVLAPERAAIGAVRLGRLAKILHGVGKSYKITDKVGKIKSVTKLGMAAETAARGARTFAIHGAVHELPPEEKELPIGEKALARVRRGVEAMPMGAAFGAVAPIAGPSRLAQVASAAGIGAGVTAVAGGSTEDILIQGGLLGALSAGHIGVKEAHKFTKEVARELDKLSGKEKEKKLYEILEPFGKERQEAARARAEEAPTEEEFLREERLEAARDRSEKMMPLGVPGEPPSPKRFVRKPMGDWLEERKRAAARTKLPLFQRLARKGVMIGEEPIPAEILTAEGRPISEIREREKIEEALRTPGGLRTAEQRLDVERLKRREELVKPGKVGVGLRVFGMKPKKPEPRRTFRMEEASEVTNTQGRKFTLPKGEEYTAYPLGKGKYRLQDGRQVTVFEGELSKIKGKMLKPGEQPLAGGLVRPKIPEFKNSMEAIIFGEKATPEEVKTLGSLRKESVEKSTFLMKEEKYNEALMEASGRGQFYREAIEASRGEVGLRPWERDAINRYKSSLIENIKSEKGSSELIGDLSRIGAGVIRKGYKSFRDFTKQMKVELGEAWDKVKHLARRAYDTSRKILVSEKGAWTIKEVEKKYQDVLKKRPRKLKAGILSTEQEKVSTEAKEFSVAVGADYIKKKETEIEWEKKANRIIRNRLELSKTIDKATKGKEKLKPEEERVLLKLNDSAYENFSNVLKTGELKEINKKIETFQEGLFKTTQDMGSELGRGLRALRRVKDIPVTDADIAKSFADVKRELRKQDIDMFNKASKAISHGDYKPMTAFLKYLRATGENPKLMDYVYEYWYNCILSGVPTHVVNVASNTAWSAWQIAVHKPLLAAIDPIVAKFQKRQTEYYLDEIVPMLAGIRKGAKPGMKAAKEIMAKGYTTEAKMDKWALEMGKTIGAFSRSPNKYLRQIAPFLTLPTKALRSMDVWANQMNFQAELGAICKRMEKQGKGKFEDLMQTPTEEMMNRASEYAAYTTFMSEPGKITKWIEKGRDVIPGGRFVVPFVRTIANLTKRGVEMTPVLGGLTLGARTLRHPVISGPEMTQLLVKQIEGVMIVTIIASLVAKGDITGGVPENKAEREAFYRQGKLPWAIKIGGKWRQYRRLEPFNGPIASVAILHDTWKKTGEVPSTDLVFRSVMGVVENILDSSYLSGLTQVLDSVRRADTVPQRLTNMIDRTVASFSPMSSFQRSFVRAIEAKEGRGAIVRKPKGLKETIKAVTPIISAEIPAKKNVWGEDVVIPGSPLEQWLPWKAAAPTKDKVEIEIERLHRVAGLPYPGVLAKYITARGERIDLTDEQYDKLMTTSGKKAKKRLDKLVDTSYWKSLSDKEKSDRISRIMRESRKTARNALKKEIGAPIERKKRRERKRPLGFIPSIYAKKRKERLI